MTSAWTPDAWVTIGGMIALASALAVAWFVVESVFER